MVTYKDGKNPRGDWGLVRYGIIFYTRWLDGSDTGIGILIKIELKSSCEQWLVQGPVSPDR